MLVVDVLEETKNTVHVAPGRRNAVLEEVKGSSPRSTPSDCNDWGKPLVGGQLDD